MGRPREFDEHDVVDRALEVFSRRGYAATSMADLVAATDLGRQSIYNAFGDKERLYREALSSYCDREDAKVVAAFDGDEPVLPRLRALLEQVADATCADEARRGCFALNAGIEGADAEAREIVGSQLARLQMRLTEALRQARTRGELTADSDPVALARFLVTVVNGLRALGRAGPDPDLARDTVRVTLSVLEESRAT